MFCKQGYLKVLRLYLSQNRDCSSLLQFAVNKMMVYATLNQIVHGGSTW